MTDNLAKGFVYMATSLDGFVAREDHSLDWLMKYENDKNDTSFEDFNNTIDAIIMGSGTFKTVCGLLKDAKDSSAIPYKKHIYVMSNTLTQNDIPQLFKDKASIVQSTPKAFMKQLYSKGLTKIYIDGGKLVQSFMNEGLIEELTITQIPILIGKGKRLFGEVEADIDLELISSRPMKPCFLQNHYRIIK